MLSYACERGRFKDIVCILDSIKAEYGEEGVAKLLNKVSKKGTNALFLAVKSGNIETVRSLWKYGKMDTRVRDFEDCTVLHMAAGNGNLEIVRLLLDGSDLLATDNENYCAFAKAVRNKHVEVARCIYEAIKERHGAQELYRAINKPLGNSLFLFCETVRENHLEAVEVNLFPLFPSFFELHKSKTKQNSQFLLGKDECNLQVEDSQKNSILHIACERSNLEMVESLYKTIHKKHEMKEDDAIINKRNRQGSAPLILAVKSQNPEVVKVMSFHFFFFFNFSPFHLNPN